MHAPFWNAERSSETYNPEFWGCGYFGINSDGNVVVDRTGNGKTDGEVALTEAVEQLKKQGGCLPALFRFPAIVEHRVSKISSAFQKAISESGYLGDQTTCYPIKANHRRAVLEKLRDCGVGLEVGTKAELLVAVAEIIQNKHLPLLCNGYKDFAYIEFATRLSLFGVDITLTLEQPSEIETLLKCADKFGHCPKIGLRLKLKVLGSGRWEKTSGEEGMFGFTTENLVAAVDLIRNAGFGDRIRMLHYHIGSQICELACIKDAAAEATKTYCEIRSEGIPLTTLDVGGGLAVEYDQSKNESFSTKDYSIENYAETIISTIKEECDFANAPHPTIYNEIGRAIAAHHSVFIFEVFENTIISRDTLLSSGEFSDHFKKLQIAATATTIDLNRVRSLHGVIEVHYNTSLIGIREKAAADRILRQVLENVGPRAAVSYYGNLSIFQSLPDVWGIKQVFPVMPIHRLNEAPKVNAKISDITCDSDGKFESFQTGVGDTIPLHEIEKGKPYMLGVFNSGAYQETIGDVHNLLARTSSMAINFKSDGTPEFELEYKGDDIGQVIEPVGFCDGEILDNLVAFFDKGAQDGIVSTSFADECGEQLERLMGSTTYMQLFPEGIPQDSIESDDVGDEA